MQSPIASSSYACKTPTDSLKCVLHTLREQSNGTVINNGSQRKSLCFVEQLLLECHLTHWKNRSLKIQKFRVTLWYTMQLKPFAAFGVSKQIKSFARLCGTQVKNLLQKDLNLFYLPNSFSPYQFTLLELLKYSFV